MISNESNITGTFMVLFVSGTKTEAFCKELFKKKSYSREAGFWNPAVAVNETIWVIGSVQHLFPIQVDSNSSRKIWPNQSNYVRNKTTLFFQSELFFPPLKLALSFLGFFLGNLRLLDLTSNR